MNVGIQLLLDNLLLNLETVLVGLSFLGSVLFTVKDFKFFPLILIGLNSVLFIWFYNVGLNFSLPLSALLIGLIIFVLLIIPANTTSTTGGFT